MAGSPFEPRPSEAESNLSRMKAAIKAQRPRDMEVVYVAMGHALAADFPNRATEYNAQIAAVTLDTAQQTALTALLAAVPGLGE